MAELDGELLRRLAEWDTKGGPVSSFYMNVDGKWYPRKHELMVKGEDLTRELEQQAGSLDKTARASVARDCQRILEWLETLDRKGIRGIALFSSSRAKLWEELALSRPVRDRASVDERPQVLQLEALFETYESFCTVIVDREKARVFLAKMGRIEEQTDIFHDVPGQHDQGGWSQARYQRHIEDHVQQHLKDVCESLLRFFKRRRFDHLILAGPSELLPEFERYLHDYLKQRIAMRTTLSMTATAAEVLERSLAVEEAIEAERERYTVERLMAEAAARAAVLAVRPAGRLGEELFHLRRPAGARAGCRGERGGRGAPAALPGGDPDLQRERGGRTDHPGSGGSAPVLS